MRGKCNTIMVACLIVVMLSGTAASVEVDALWQDTASCDAIDHVFPSPVHELGPKDIPGDTGAFPGFPPEQAIIMSSAMMGPTDTRPCVGDDGNTNNDYVVTITNDTSPPSIFRDLFVVADVEFFDPLTGGSVPITLGNADGVVTDVNDPNQVPALALYVDALGVNANLLGGDGDELFEPGETWQILLANFGPGPPILPSGTSVGLFAGSSSLDNDFQQTSPVPSSLSFIATRVPEPSSFTLLALGLAALAASSRCGRVS